MFANLKAKLLKVDLRKGGKKVFVFESNVRMSAGELEAINEMIDQEVALGLDSQVINYSVRKNAKTDQPIITYKVNDRGEVEEVKPQGEQMELPLGLPPEKTPIKEEAAEISRTIVEEFILEGLAPRYPDLEYDFEKITKRHTEGETYLRIASELELSSGKLAELLDEYYTRIAPLVAKWNEWRESQRQQVENVIATASSGKEELKEAEHEAGLEENGDGMDLDFGEDAAAPDAAGDGGTESIEAKDEVEAFILSGKELGDEDYNWELLLRRKKEGETWMQIANSIGVTSSKLSTDWNHYKKRVKEHLAGEEHGAA